MGRPRVSLIATVRNKEAWVGETLISIEQQSYANWEALYVNDGSTDSTPIVLDALAKRDPRFRIIHWTENRGIAKALNYASSLAKADLIMVCSGDDVYHADRVRRAIKYFKKHPEIDVFYESYILAKANLEENGLHKVVPFNLEEYLKILPNGRANQMVPHGFCAYRTAVARAVSYDETRKVGVDYPFFAEVAKAGFKFGCNPDEIAGLYRILPQSVTRTHMAQINQEDKAYATSTPAHS